MIHILLNSMRFTFSCPIHLFMYDSPHSCMMWITFSCMIHLFLYDSPWKWITCSWMIHFWCAWLTFSCMIHLFMHDSPFHVWFTFSCMIHLFMNDSPFALTIHLFIYYSHIPWKGDSPFVWMIHLFMYDSPFHAWFTFSCMIQSFSMNPLNDWPFHVNRFTFPGQIFLNDSPFHARWINFWNDSPFIDSTSWKGDRFSLFILLFTYSWMIHLLMNASPFHMKWFTFSVRFKCMIHLFMHDSPVNYT